MGLAARAAPMLPVRRWRQRVDLLPQDLRQVPRGGAAPPALTYGSPSSPPTHPMRAPITSPAPLPGPGTMVPAARPASAPAPPLARQRSQRVDLSASAWTRSALVL